MDDEIIYSLCFNSAECFDSTSSTAIIILVKNLESLSSLIFQHFYPCDEGWRYTTPRMSKGVVTS